MSTGASTIIPTLDHPAPSLLGRAQVAGPIIAAVSGGSGSRRVVQTAATIAEHWGTSAEVLSAVTAEHPLHSVALGIEPGPTATAESRRRHEIDAALGSRVAGGVPVAIGIGSPPHVIANEARRRHASLIVLGREAAEARARLPGRAVTARTLRLAPCPLVIVRSAWSALPRRVAVACDFTLPAVWAAEMAGRLVHPEGRLDVIHIVPTIHDAAEATGWGARYREWCETRFGELAALIARSSPVTPRLVMSAGEPALQVMAEAHALDADLLALGASGAGAVERLLVGSVASILLDHAPGNILVAPTPPPTERDRLASAMHQREEHADALEWPDVLAGFSTRHDGRSAWLETVDPDRGGFAHETGFVFHGATYEPASHRVLLMLGRDAEPRRHMTRSIDHPSKLAVHSDVWGREAALSVWHGDGVTELRLLREPG